jgi:glycerol-3-phosphate dehydrogenase
VIPRADALATFERERFDVVVIGGGITGAGVALDAASRGYSVALVERDDYASGTSSRSSKLIHGGLRYLQKFDLGLVREALIERALLVGLAPHLVHPLPLLVTAFEGRHPDRLTGVGLNMYDVMAMRRGPGGTRWRRRAEDDGAVPDDDWGPDRHRTIGPEETVELLPALAARRPTSAYLFYDSQTDDARLVLTVLGEAERFGAVCANGCEVTGLLARDARAAGVRIRDRVGGGELELRAANVVNATGVWADRISPEELYAEEEVPRIRPSRGTHVIFAPEDLPVRAGAIVPAGDARTIFVLPWLGRTLVGTTDNDYDGPLEHVPPSGEDVEYLLAACNDFFGTALGAEDVAGAFAGVRPLISTGDPRKSVDISRRAELYETSSGMVTITGGKLTTWRRMARMAVDRLVEREGRELPCRTAELPLGMPMDPGQLPEVEGVGADTRRHLADRYGYAARDVLELAAAAPELRGRIVPEAPDLVAEAAFAARREQARSAGDALLRRTRLALTHARALCAPGAEGPELVAWAMADGLGWDEGRVAAEVDAFAEVAAAEGLVPGVAAAPAGSGR